MKRQATMLFAMLASWLGGTVHSESNPMVVSVIAGQPLSNALSAFARQTGLQLVYVSKEVTGLVSKGSPAGLGSRETLTHLLEGTGLSFQFLNERTVRIFSSPPNSSATQKLVLPPAPDSNPFSGTLAPPTVGTAIGTGSMAQARQTNENTGEKTMKRRGLFARLASWFAVCSVAVHSTNTCAQTNSGADQSTQLQEVVVTAQRRSENLEDVPIAVTPLSGKDVEALHLDNAGDLQAVVPGLLFNQGGAIDQIYLRGVGNNIGESNADQSIATYVDGVYVSNSASTNIELADIQSIEVLKGPQGTLFGRNATGGAINITTLSPTDELQGRFSGGIGDYRRHEGDASISGPVLGDKLLGGVYVDYQEHDPYTTITNPPGVALPDVPTKDRQGSVRGKLVFNPESSVKITASADFSRYVNFDNVAFRQLQPNATGYAFGAVPNPGHYSISLADPEDDTYTSAGGSLRTDIDLGRSSLVEISAYRAYKTFWELNLGATSYVPGGVGDHVSTRQWSHELQWLSKSDDRFQWILGLFYFTDDGGDNPFDVLPPKNNVNIDASVDDTSYAGYGQGTWSVIDGLRLIFGGRYTWEKKDYVGGDLDVFTPSGAELLSDPLARQQKTWSNFSPKAGLDYRLGSTLAYATFSEGFKSGAFNLYGTTPAGIAPVNPETLYAYELGTKSELLDKRLRLNTSLFYYDYKNLQVETLLPGALASLQNAATAYTSGLDFDVNYLIVPDFELRVLGEFLRSHYGSFPAFEGYVPAAVGNTPKAINVSGYTAARAPAFSGDLGGTYTFHLPQGADIRSTASIYHSGNFAFNSDHTVTSSAYTTLELSAALSPQSHAWSASLWAKNLTDSYYFSYKNINSTGIYAVAGAPRTFGVDVTFYLGKGQ